MKISTKKALNNLIKITLLGAAVSSTTGCAAFWITAGATTAVAATGTAVAIIEDDRGASVVLDDQKLEHSVNSSLNQYYPNANFTVASYNYHVLLTGQVATTLQKEGAQLKVEDLPNVRGVYNYLEVRDNVSFAQSSKDTLITSEAKTLLIAQSGVNANNIKVVTADGVVYLLGAKAGFAENIKVAANGIATVDGVKKVVDLIKY